MVDCQNLSRKALTDYQIEHSLEVTENILKTLYYVFQELRQVSYFSENPDLQIFANKFID
jgi:hypothetical protein